PEPFGTQPVLGSRRPMNAAAVVMTGPGAVATRWITLRDGAIVEVRRLGADDYDAVIRLAETRTERERYLRFFTAHPNYLDEWARSLTETKSGDHGRQTVGAFEDDMLVGLANYVATAQSGRAEVSVVVAHEQHERGVGTALLRILGLLARDNGIHHLEADVLTENHSMQWVVAEAGWPCSCARDGFVLCYDVDLDAVGITRNGSRRDDSRRRRAAAAASLEADRR
ncbi:MAG: GNAT family N-acetyltransferase, partial [Myxococcota bacterium]